MPIIVKHGTPASTIVAGAAGGQNKAVARANEQVLSVIEKKRTRSLEHEHAKKMQDTRLAAQERLHEESLGAFFDRLESSQGFQEERDIFALAGAKEGYTFELTAKQRAEEESYRDALYEIEQSEDYTEEEKEEARRRVQAKMADIKPLPKRKTDGYLKGQGVGEVWSDDTGLVFTRDPNGGVKKLGQSDRVTMKDRVSAWSAAIQLATDENGRVNREEVQRFVSEILGENQESERGEMPGEEGAVPALTATGEGEDQISLATGSMALVQKKMQAIQGRLNELEGDKPPDTFDRVKYGLFGTYKSAKDAWKRKRGRLLKEKSRLQDEIENAIIAASARQKLKSLARGVR